MPKLVIKAQQRGAKAPRLGNRPLFFRRPLLMPHPPRRPVIVTEKQADPVELFYQGFRRLDAEQPLD
jgi:hypothetical protein